MLPLVLSAALGVLVQKGIEERSDPVAVYKPLCPRLTVSRHLVNAFGQLSSANGFKSANPLCRLYQRLIGGNVVLIGR